MAAKKPVVEEVKVDPTERVSVTFVQKFAQYEAGDSASFAYLRAQALIKGGAAKPYAEPVSDFTPVQ